MVFFYLLLTFLILGLALAPTLFNNPVRSVIAFIFVFLLVAGLLLSINIEFLAFVYAIVYIGAVAVLFLFVVMLLKVSSKYTTLFKIYWIALLLIFILFLTWQIIFIITNNLIFLNIFKNNNFIPHENIIELPIKIQSQSIFFATNELYEIAARFYNLFSMVFIETAFILLIALIGIIVLVTQEAKKE